ncbi:MAG: hypothetical protein QNJ81_07205 [Acidimicrobiia bacterium]|nr:hypothetical protein [Acidimicrobiia bacterium]
MEQEELVELTRERLSQIAGRGGINVVQAALLGLEVPMRKGSSQQLLWRQIPRSLFLRVLYYTDVARPNKVLRQLQKDERV